jgi:hypothetical protein
MLIMNISTPQQDIGVRVSLPLESHHIDIFLENVLPVRADDKVERNKVERKRVDIARNAREVCALEIKINRSEKPQQNPSWDCHVDYEYLYSTTRHRISGISPAGITSYRSSQRISKSGNVGRQENGTRTRG